MKHYTKPCPKTMSKIEKMSESHKVLDEWGFETGRVRFDFHAIKINEIIDRINNLDDRKKK